jgi:hypothetical protein
VRGERELDFWVCGEGEVHSQCGKEWCGWSGEERCTRGTVWLRVHVSVAVIARGCECACLCVCAGRAAMLGRRADRERPHEVAHGCACVLVGGAVREVRSPAGPCGGAERTRVGRGRVGVRVRCGGGTCHWR